jgi:hypothetical protein
MGIFATSYTLLDADATPIYCTRISGVMTLGDTVRLKVRQVDRSCVFDLSDAEGLEISAILRYDEQLAERYQSWRQIYRRRYELQTRARVACQGGGGTPSAYDWDQELKLSELALLEACDRWLGQVELLEIRETLQHRLTPIHADRSEFGV